MATGKSFVERPKIPSLSEITKDIEEAPVDDIAFKSDFSSLNNDLNGADDVEGEEDNGNRKKLEKLNANISEAYAKAVQMVKLCEILREAPSKLEHEYKDLENQGQEVSNAIEDLKRSSQSLPQPTANKPTQKKKKGKK